ncbi:MAG: putative ABC transporter permease, partial [Ruminococcus sp.]|nr:putative ABC transporter permease [Ruminococcus sp.]
YSDVYEEYGRKLPDTAQLKGLQRILAEVFGVTVRRSQAIETLETEQSLRFQLEYDKKASESLVYPTRLYPIPEHKKRKWIASQNYLRYYSVWSVILIFFTLSFAGWVWEVSLHLITDGEFANRGVMHGPWLPIYGCGSVMILLLLNKFRRKPAVEFVLAMLLCGCVEYFTSLFLESLHGGTRWWDYTGYFLNLQGRICAEGLLTFGIGGMAIVYVLVPFLDGLFRKLPVRALIITACILSAAFAVDQVYSLKYPNEGKGITDFQEVTVSGTAVNIFDS